VRLSAELRAHLLESAQRSHRPVVKHELWPKTGAFSAETEKNQNDEIHFNPKTKLTENSQNPHFWRRKQKRKRERNSVGLYL